MAHIENIISGCDIGKTLIIVDDKEFYSLLETMRELKGEDKLSESLKELFFSMDNL
jgi:hypothetical protein